MCLIGIQPESMETSTELSDVVGNKMDALIDKVFEGLKEWGVEAVSKKIFGSFS